MPEDYLTRQEICVGLMPTTQIAVDCISDWSSQFPSGSGLTGGNAALFEDQRLVWALQRLGGVKGKRVLELGPLEGGHTYMLEQAGPRKSRRSRRTGAAS